MTRAITIVAPATAPGRAGVAVLRVSGPRAREAFSVFAVPCPAPRRATLATLLHENEVIDRALVLWFPAPGSFTGEDVAELHLHGGRAVLARVLAALLARTEFRLAEPGEFTRRALAHGKMSLLEVEGLADVINAETEAQRAQAMRALSGNAGQVFDALRAEVLRALAHLEAYIDFPEEDIPPTLAASVEREVGALKESLATLLADDRRGERVREGFSVVIAGAPNAGKSSLMNALARRDVAIVSTTAGTTRDVIEVHLDIEGTPVVLVDTAGLRESADPIEQEGIRRARARVAHADLTLVLFSAEALPALDAPSLALLGGESMPLISKADMLHAAPPSHIKDWPAMHVSVRDEASVRNVLSHIKQALDGELPPSPALITRARHRAHVQKSLEYLQTFSLAEPLELACEELRLAAREIGHITGAIDVEELLGHIFAEFCIGK